VLRIVKYLIRLDKQRGDLLEGAGEAPFEQGMSGISCNLLELIMLLGSILTLIQTTLSMTETATRTLRFLRLSRTLKMMIMPSKNWMKNLHRIWVLEEGGALLEEESMLCLKLMTLEGHPLARPAEFKRKSLKSRSSLEELEGGYRSIASHPF
jgi:hypothetical protein